MVEKQYSTHYYTQKDSHTPPLKMKTVSIAACSLLIVAVSAFAPARQNSQCRSPSKIGMARHAFSQNCRGTALFSSEEPQETESSKAPPALIQVEETADYPLNVPSPLLLGGSMVLGISGIGKYLVSV
jgi:hypothetical protein